MKHKLIIAAAGSGKTSYLINEALKITNCNVLILTYTIANKEEINNRIIHRCGFIPSNITIKTWFSFLFEHGVRPYHNQLLYCEIKGFCFCSKPSGYKYTYKGRPVFYSETELGHYLSTNQLIYSDKISKFVYKCNEKTSGAITKRLSCIFQYIFIDEVQDLAGYDLEFIKQLIESNSKLLLVGDPRQVTYLTHHPKINKKYMGGAIKSYINDLPKKYSTKVEIDENILSASHRNNAFICDFSSLLYPEYSKSKACNCIECNEKRNVNHKGIFLVKESDVAVYCEPLRIKHLQHLHKIQKRDFYN